MKKISGRKPIVDAKLKLTVYKQHNSCKTGNRSEIYDVTFKFHGQDRKFAVIWKLTPIQVRPIPLPLIT